MKKGDILEGVVTGFDFPNKGSLMVDDRRVIIKGVLKGQRVRFMVTKKKSGKAEGRLLEILEKSPIEDAEPFCSYFGLCGGCSYQTLSYKNQLTLKEEMVKGLLDKVVKTDISNEDYWEGILASPVQTEYRNKMEFTFGDEFKDGPLVLGLHKKGSFHDIQRVIGCKIVNDDWSKIMSFTQDFFTKKNVPFYHRMRHEGILRNLVVRQSKATGEFLINLVASTQWDKYGFEQFVCTDLKSDCTGQNNDYSGALSDMAKEFVAGLIELEKTEEFSGKLAGIIYTENDTLGDVVQSDRSVLLYGRDSIMEELNCDGVKLKFRISPFSFFQTNTKGCEVLYSKAREYIMCGDVMKGESGKIVFDLYSGTGTIAQMMAGVSKKVIGIEIVEEAVEAAKENAKLNGLDNCEFIAGDVLKAIDLVEDKPDMIIVDPPRDGINPKALEKILAFGVDEIVYISCKPTSLVRDLEVMQERGYRVVKGCAVDQFPGTSHVETIVGLQRRDT